MIVLNLQLNGVYGFNNFNINFTYPKKIINSIIEDEFYTENNESIGMDTKVVTINEVPIKV